MLLSCPDQELLLEFVTIPQEIGLRKRLLLKAHLKACAKCEKQAVNVQKKWNSYFQPQPEITSSLIKVYSRLKTDETLILKGWKLGSETARSRTPVIPSGWLFRGAVVSGVTIAGVFLALTQFGHEDKDAALNQNKVPFAQLRLEEKNRVKVQYMKPELIQTVEFETSGR